MANLRRLYPISRRRFEEKLAGQLNNLKAGIPIEILEEEGANKALEGSDYVLAYISLQRARARVLLAGPRSSPDRPSPVTRQLMENLGIPLEMQIEAENLGPDDPRLLAVLTECWRGDALQAFRRLDILRLLLPAMVLPILFILYLEISPDIDKGGLRQALSAPFVTLPVFGFLGAALSLLIDKSKSHRSPHWSAVWRAINRLRLASGLVVGFALAYFAPSLLPSTDPTTSNLPTLYLFAMAFGFSQDVFLAKLQAISGDGKIEGN